MIGDVSGNFLLRLAREAMRQYLKHRRILDRPPRYPAELNVPAGVIIELYRSVPARTLSASSAAMDFERPVIDNTISCAVAAVQDIKLHELPVMRIALYIVPELLELHEQKIEPGRHGLYIKNTNAILMPNVPVERKWTIRECLENLCIKAGLPKDAWTDPSVKLYKFEPEVFREAP